MATERTPVRRPDDRAGVGARVKALWSRAKALWKRVWPPLVALLALGALVIPVWLLSDNYSDSAGAERLPNDVGLAVPRYDYFDTPIEVYSPRANSGDFCITFELIGIDEGASQITLGVLVGVTEAGEQYLKSIKHPPKTGNFLLSSENGLNDYPENFPLAPLKDAPPVSCEGGNISMSHLALNSRVAFDLTVFVLGTPRAYPNDWYELDDAVTVSIGNTEIPSSLLLATRDEDYTVSASVYRLSTGKGNAGPGVLEFTVARSRLYYWYIYLVASLPFVLLVAVFSFKYLGKRQPGPKPFEVAFGIAATLVAILPLRSVLIPASLPTPTRLDLYFGLGGVMLVSLSIIWAVVLRLGDHNDEPEEGTTQPPPSSETDDEAKARHLAWLNHQCALRPSQIRETYKQHGPGYWQGIYGDNPAFTYVPSARADRVFHLAEAYDPDDQFVVVIQDLPRIGIHTARMVSDSEITFLD